MSRQGTRIAWFITLSAAIHVAAMLMGNRSETSIGTAGRVIHVSMTYRAGAAGPASPAADPVARARAHPAQPHLTTNRPTPVSATRKAVDRHHDNPSHETTAPQPVTARQAGDAPATAKSATASGTETARRTAEEQLRKSILQLVSSRFNYPVLARRKGMQGIVKLEVRIESNGRISRLHVKQTSGYPVLDRAAVQSLQLANVPDAGQWMQGQAIDIIIPVEYRLVGG